MNVTNSSWTVLFISHIKRDVLVNTRSLIDVISVFGFMLLIIILFPIGIGPTKEKLDIVSNAVLWISLIIAIIPSLEKMLQKDFDSGWLDQIATSPAPLEIILLAKSISHWLIVIIPLILASPLFAILLDLEFNQIPWIILSMSIGGLSISLIGIIGAALVLGARRGNVLLPVLIIPLIIPILIFGVGINEAVEIGNSPLSHLFLLIAFSLIYLVISPFVSALLIRIAISR
jgi:heme exporter protein B